MPYSAEISRSNPTCFLFLIDQSKSMLGPIPGGDGKKKADAVADSLNRLLYTLVLRCVWGQAVLDRFHVGVLGYGRQVVPSLGGALANRELVPISELARCPLRVEQRVNKVDDGRGGQVEQIVKAPLWFEPVADGKTPMSKCFERAAQVLSNFLIEHPSCYPPLVVNLTDGEATDGDPEKSAQHLRELASEDGAVLLFNAHISSRPERRSNFPIRRRVCPMRRAPAVPHVELSAAGHAELGAAVGPGRERRLARLRLQRRPGLGGPLSGHWHARRFQEPQVSHARPRTRPRLSRFPSAASGLPPGGMPGRLDRRSGARPLRHRRRRRRESAFRPVAHLLVEEFVRQSERLPNWSSWLPSLQQRWSAQVNRPPDGRSWLAGSAEAGVPWYLEPGLMQGAFATFLGLVVEETGWHALAVGDSCLFQVRQGELVRSFPITRAADFSNAPWLVGSRTSPGEVPHKKGLQQQGDCRPRDRFWMMTDALAQWFLVQIEAGGKPWLALDPLLHAVSDEVAAQQAFATWIEDLRAPASCATTTSPCWP